MQMKSTLATMKTAASMVIFVAMGSSTAYASYVPPTQELPGNTPAGLPNFGYTEKARVPEQGQQGFNLKAGGIGNIPDSVCIPVNAMVDGGCTINEVVNFSQQDGSFTPPRGGELQGKLELICGSSAGPGSRLAVRLWSDWSCRDSASPQVLKNFQVSVNSPRLRSSTGDFFAWRIL